MWDNYTSYTAGTLVKYKGLVYTKDSGTGTVGSPPTGLTAATEFTIARVTGSGTDPITLDSSTASKITYSLYDADDVKYWRYFGWESRDQRWVTRHQVTTTVDTKVPVFQNVNSFLQQFNGILAYQSGKYSLSVATQTDTISSNISGGYEQNARYITNEDIIGSVDVKDAGPKKSFNSVEATISDPAIKWGDRQVSFYDSNYLKADRGIKKGGNLVVSGITNYQNARISVENYLRKSRFGLSVTFTIGPKGLILLAGDTIKLTYDRFSWSDKLFRITNLQFKEDCTVQVSAHEYDDSMYTITGPTAIDIENLDNKPGLRPTIGPPTTLAAATSLNEIKLTWARDTDASANTVTEIWMRVGTNHRTSGEGATLIHTTGGTETSYTYSEGVDIAPHYFWIRHKKPLVGSQGISTNVITSGYSTYEPATPANTTAGSFVPGRVYTIVSAGNTDFTAIGAANSTAGTTFTATGAGSGTGTASSDPGVEGKIERTGFTPTLMWTFPSDNQSWAAANATLTHQGAAKTTLLEATAGDPQLYLSGLTITGSENTIVRAKVMRKAGSSWQGTVYYVTSGGHDYSESYRKTIADTTVTNEWTILEWDMGNLSSGTDDWKTSTITAIRLDIGHASSDDFLIDWIGVGSGSLKQAALLGEAGAVEGINTFDSDGALITSVNNNDLQWGSMAVTSGSIVTGWTTEDQSDFLPDATTSAGTLSITHPSKGTYSSTFTWTRTGLNVTNFTVTTGSGDGAFAAAAFGSAGMDKTIAVTHTSSGRVISMKGAVLDLSNLGGCLLPGSMIKHPGGETPIEELEVGTKVIAYDVEKAEEVEAEMCDKAPHKANFYYKVNDLKLTSGHPIWANDGWACVDPAEYKRECLAYGHTLDLKPSKLEIGDLLYNGAPVKKIERVDEATEVWNIIIKDIHTYIANGILVHNGGGGGGKCLTPAMLPEGLGIGDYVDSPEGKTKVVDIVHKQREGYYILENELEITNDHPILWEGKWIKAEDYPGNKKYIEGYVDVVYVETENELLTVKGWTVGGKY